MRTPVVRVLLGAVLLACILGRGAYVLHLVHTHAIVTERGDAPSYLLPAHALADHGRFETASASGKPEFLRTPGYPLFIAAVFRIFGDRVSAVLLVQVLLSAVTVLLVYLLGARMWSPVVGLIAAALTAVEPLQNATTSTVLTESLSALLLIALAGIGYEVFRRNKPPLSLLALLGFVLAVVTFVRPSTYYLPLFVVVMLFVRYARRRDHGTNFVKMTALFLAPIVLLFGGWQLRNHERVDSWRFSGIEGKNLYKYRAAGVIARSQHIPIIDARELLTRRIGDMSTKSQGSYYGRMLRDGTHIVMMHPRDAMIGTLAGLGSELFSVRYKLFQYLDLDPASGTIEGIAVAILAVFYALLVYGVVLVVRRRREVMAHVFVLGIAAYVLLLSAGPEAFGGRGERFRAPVMPILILYAAYGLHELWRGRRPAPAPLLADTARDPASAIIVS